MLKSLFIFGDRWSWNMSLKWCIWVQLSNNGKFPQTCSISSVWLLPKRSHSVQIAWCMLSARLFTTDWPSLSTAVGWEIPAQLLWSLEKPLFGPQMKPIRATCTNSITRQRIDKTFMHENTIYIIISWYVYTALFFGSFSY